MDKPIPDENVLDKKQSFLMRTLTRRKELADKLALELLAYFSKSDIPFFDVHYIERRVIQILEERIKQIDFSNPVIDKARKDFLRTCMGELQKTAFVLPKSLPTDETEERDQRDEEVCQQIVNTVIDEKVLMADPDYLTDAIKDDDELLLVLICRGMIKEIFEILRFSIDQSYLRCNRMLWGDRDREQITFARMDELLKILAKNAKP